jgi:rhamnulokinase
VNRKLNLAAVDLGAESGRVMLARFDGKTITLEEAHRFPNIPVNANGILHWDALRLWYEIKLGIRAAAKLTDGKLSSVGVDTWGVDFGLLDANDQLIGNPIHYRDTRTNGMLDWVFERAPREKVYARTGIQFNQINTLFQLAAMVKQRSPMLEIGKSFLTIPDLIHFWLCGVKANEYTNATTTQCLDARTRDWARDLLDQVGIPSQIFCDVIPPATKLGMMRSTVAEEIGIAPIPVIAPATHDTGSAVAAAPITTDSIYISSGTWSLMGIESDAPIIDNKAFTYNVTNEGGVNGTIRVLKNIMGLWLLQECRRVWAGQGRAYDYSQLEAMARESKTSAIVDVNDARFLSQGDMPARIREFCVETNQPPPEIDAEIARCVLNSLANEYRIVVEQLDDLTGKRQDSIHIFGGGSQNVLLNELTAKATGRQVFAGPVEATALGNAIAQLVALGELVSFDEGRELQRG